MTIRCFAQPAQWTHPDIILDREESHHLLRVMRLDKGAEVYAHDGQGTIAQCEIMETEDNAVTLRILDLAEHPRQPLHIILVQALIKNQKMDWVIQKAVELGAAEIIGLETEHAVVRIKEKEYPKRIARWQSIAQSALKQCGRPWLPDITMYPSMQKLLATRTDITTWLLCTLSQPDPQMIGDITPSATTAIIIGPEGDFTPHEVDQAIQAAAIPVSLGSYVLRAETAALYALSLLTAKQ